MTILAGAPPATVYPANGWWVVKDSNGAIGVVKGSSPGSNAVAATYVGAANSINDLAMKFSTQLASAIGSIGATGKQQASLIAELDAGAGKNSNTSWLYVGPNPSKVSSNTSTALTGDAQATSIIPTPSIPGVGNLTGAIGAIFSWLTTPAHWVRILEYVAGAALLYLGVRELVHG